MKEVGTDHLTIHRGSNARHLWFGKLKVNHAQQVMRVFLIKYETILDDNQTFQYWLIPPLSKNLKYTSFLSHRLMCKATLKLKQDKNLIISHLKNGQMMFDSMHKVDLFWPRKFKGGIPCGSHLAITYGGQLLYLQIFGS